MLMLLRSLLLGLLLIGWFIFGTLLCLVRPRHPNNVYAFAQLFHKICPLLGLTVTIKVDAALEQVGPAVYICNHQSNFDIFTVIGAVRPGVVAVGKKSLKWIPLFGQLFWLSGNVLIDRSNRSRARGTINQVVDKIKQHGTSIWMFPEGTRSQGRGLLPFKAGAFHTAVQAGVPIVPVVCSSYFHQINLNRWDNGEIIIEMLAPVRTDEVGATAIRELSDHCRDLIAERLVALDASLAAQRN
ncbi:MAG: 1-acylglycerol-3-phosphate O-acyltransferase [Aeromonas sp.]